MDLIEFLKGFVPQDMAGVPAAASIGGLAIYALIEYIDQKLRTLSPNVKFVISMALAFGLPTGAYVALQLLSAAAVTFNGLFLAAAVGWAISQGIHRADEQTKNVQTPDAQQS